MPPPRPAPKGPRHRPPPGGDASAFGAVLRPGPFSFPPGRADTEREVALLVRHHMSREVLTLAPDEACRQALRRLTSREVRHAPVLEENRLVGIVSERDLLRVLPATVGEVERALARNEPEPLVRHAMRKRPRVVHPDERLESAALLLREKRIGAVPVVEEGRLVGILTATDVLAAFGSIFTDTPGCTVSLLLPPDRREQRDPIALAVRIGIEVVAALPDRRPDGTRLVTLRLNCDEVRLAHFRRLIYVAGYLLLENSRGACA